MSRRWSATSSCSGRLRRLRPQLHGQRTLLGDVDHAVRCWGPEAVFDDLQFSSSADLLRVLTDDRRYMELYGPEQPPLLIDGSHGVTVRAQAGLPSTPHTDHTAACLAEIGLPLHHPLDHAHRRNDFSSPGGTGPVRFRDQPGRIRMVRQDLPAVCAANHGVDRDRRAENDLRSADGPHAA